MHLGTRRIGQAVLVSLFAVVLFPSSLLAAPIEIGLGEFGAGATTVDFDGYATDEPPTIPGMTLSGGSFEAQGGGDWGGDDPGRNTLTMDELTITFDEPMGRVGFVFGGNTDNTVPFATLNGAVTTGSYTLTSMQDGEFGTENWLFYGFEDPDGITSITFSEETSNGWVYGLIDLTYEERSIMVPAQPTSLGSIKSRY